MAMLFTPNDFNSSRVRAISGVAHSHPEVWAETVMPFMKGGDGVAALAEEIPRTTTRKTRRHLSVARRNDRILEQIIEEKCIEAKVACQQSPRFGTDAEQPGQSRSLHPGGCIRFQPGVDVEGKANRKDHSAPDGGLVAVDPLLLFWRAESDPDEVRGQSVDFVDNLRLFLRRKITMMRANDPRVRRKF